MTLSQLLFLLTSDLPKTRDETMNLCSNGYPTVVMRLLHDFPTKALFMSPLYPTGYTDTLRCKDRKNLCAVVKVRQNEFALRYYLPGFQIGRHAIYTVFVSKLL
jgi:hypothetical protein